MKLSKPWALALLAAALCAPSTSRAQERACASRITRATVVRCALSASLVVAREREELSATRARETAASPLLPSNPVLALSGARRNTPSLGATNWYATLSQEVEIAGQRGKRRDAAEAAVRAQSRRVLLSRRETAARAWAAFFDAVAAREEVRLAGKLATAAKALGTAARARAEQGLIAPVDADVADATAIRVLQAKLAAERHAATARASLAAMLGLSPGAPPAVEGELRPLEGVEAALARSSSRAVARRPEVLALESERRAQELRADALRRERIPNPTLSVFAQNDGFNERVFGVGLALPIPLPGNVGRTNVGEIAESEALARRAEAERERAARAIRLDIATAAQAYASRTKEVRAFSGEVLARAETTLSALGQEVEAGRLAVRDAIVAQQSLIELLQASVEARRAWCLSSVALARALGLPLEGSAR